MLMRSSNYFIQPMVKNRKIGSTFKSPNAHQFRRPSVRTPISSDAHQFKQTFQLASVKIIGHCYFVESFLLTAPFSFWGFLQSRGPFWSVWIKLFDQIDMEGHVQLCGQKIFLTMPLLVFPISSA